ncbi:MAG: ATP-binding cassette domain-containing protein [Candidatus Delongbacteria bacterium]|nr:ATP-binding cassette domain-containing protein [Candidatus Delongbacteria bacterium]
MDNKLVTVTKGLDNVKDLKSLLIKLTDITKELLSADRCSIFLYDEKKDDLFTYVAHGVDEIRISKSKGIVGHCYVNNKTLNIQDAQNEPLYSKESEKFTGYKTLTMLSMPIASKNKMNIVGVFQVLNKTNNKPFNIEDEELLKNMSSYAASLLSKALNYANSMKLDESEMETITNVFDDDIVSKISTSIIPLRIRANINEADVYFPYEGLQVDIYSIENNFFIIQKDDLNTVSVDNYILDKNTPFKVLFNSNIKINDYTILYEQIKSYFKIKLNYYNKKTFFLNKQEDEIILDKEKDQTSIAKLFLVKSIIKIELLSDDSELLINRVRGYNTIYVNINDVIQINGKNLNIKKIVYENIIEKEFYHIDLEEFDFTISNKKADIVVEDEIDHQWKCLIRLHEGKYYFINENCPYDVYLNDKTVTKYELKQGDKLYINGNILILDFENNSIERSRFSFSSFVVNKVKHYFSDNTLGIDDISFEMEHGDLIAVMGPSGCGKSTLLNIINGNYKPSQGDVSLDNIDLHENYAFLKNFMGFVPQDDLLFDNLTVYENLFYNAKLRNPGKKKEILVSHVDKVLKDINLFEKKNTKVGNALDKTLSGGERKRLNIGLELLADSEVLLLDEPTSGLSSKDSEKIIELLKRISLDGKIVYVIIHQPSSKIYKIFDKLILLDKGGKLAFYGNNYNCLKYFREHSRQHFGEDIECPACKNVEPDLILETLEEPARDKDGTPLDHRKHTPDYWKEEFNDYQKVSSSVKIPQHKNQFIPPKPKLTIIEKFMQFFVLLQRNFVNKLRDKSNLAITFLEAPVLGAIIALLLKYIPGEEYSLYDNKYLMTFIFLSVIVSIFFALSNSVDEIIKDATILLREKMLNINSFEYYVSKFLTLMVFSIVQNLLFLIVGFWILELKELFVNYLLILTLVSIAGTSMGLFISSFPKLTSKAAQNIIPLILVPQIIFGGFIVKFQDINRSLFIDKNVAIPEICQVMISRWGLEALCITQDKYNSYHSQKDELQSTLDEFIENKKMHVKVMGKKEYNEKKSEILKQLDVLRLEYKKPFGNRELHTTVNEAKEDFTIGLSKKYGAKIPMLSEIDVVYPMFINEKRLPYTNKIISTEIYNSIIMALFAALLAMISILMLAYREKITKLQQKIIMMFKK